MPVTFEEIWRHVRLHAPGVPVTLVELWTQDTYAELTDYRPWSWTLLHGQLVFQALHTINQAIVTAGSTTVTSPDNEFVPGDAGRQFRVYTYPIYTVASYVSAGEITLDLPYQGTPTGATTAQVLDAYATLPANFRAFTALVDPVNQRWVPWWVTQEELALLDPIRMAADNTPRILAARALSTYPPTIGQVQYEYWPIPVAAGALQYYIRVGPSYLNDQSIFQGVLASRGDVLKTGTLAKCARWPGTKEAPNPYFNLALAKDLEAKFLALMVQLDLRDDDVYQQSIDKVPWQRWTAWSWAYSTRLLQMTDATLSSYFGMGAYPSWY